MVALLSTLAMNCKHTVRPIEATLDIVSVPPNALVYVDGACVSGRSPVRLAGLPAGSHRIALAFDHYFDTTFIHEVRVDATDSVVVTMRYMPIPGLQTPVFPVYHDYPAYFGAGTLWYTDLGRTCVDVYGFYHVDTTLAGVWVEQLASHQRTRLVARARDASLSTDQKYLAYIDAGSLVVANADGSGPMMLPVGNSCSHPRWRPGSDELIFDSDRESSNFNFRA